MRSTEAILALLATTAVQAAPNKNGVEFLFPADNSSLTLNYLDTIVVTYNSPFENPLLYTFCTNVSNTKDLIQKEVIKVSPKNGSHAVKLDYQRVEECYWNIRPNTSTGFGGNSAKITLLSQAGSGTTVGLGLQIPTPTSSSGSNPTNPPPSDGASNGGLSTGAKAGIGAGIGVVALIAIVAFAFFLMKRRKNKKGTSNEMTTVGGSSELHGGGRGPTGYTGLPQKEAGYEGAPKWGGPKVNELPTTQERPVYEMSGERDASEVPGSGVKR